MTGMSINEFLDKIYYGDVIHFALSNITYFIQGNFINNVYTITVDSWEKNDGTEPLHDYLLNASYKTPQERMDAFEQAKIFDGKTIYDIESDVKVIWG